VQNVVWTLRILPSRKAVIERTASVQREGQSQSGQYDKLAPDFVTGTYTRRVVAQ